MVAPTKRAGFSLIEMLVVIAIIAVLSGMLLTAIHNIRLHARKVKARHDVEQVVTAWSQYLQEYKRFPALTITTMGSNAIAVLRGTTFHADNRRQITFMDFGTNTTHFADPWGADYHVVLDTTGNNAVTVPEGPINLTAAVWSDGPDGVSGTGDDIRSWRK